MLDVVVKDGGDELFVVHRVKVDAGGDGEELVDEVFGEGDACLTESVGIVAVGGEFVDEVVREADVKALG